MDRLEKINARLSKFSDRQIVAHIIGESDYDELLRLVEGLEKNYGVSKE